MSYISPEGVVIPAGGDNWNLTTDLRTQAASTRSVVSVASRTAADSVATAMAADGRAVSASNPLVVYNQAKRALEIKDNTGWVDGGIKYSEFAATNWTINGGSVAWDIGPLVLDAAKSYNNTFSTASTTNGAINITESGVYSFTSSTLGASSPGNAWVSNRLNGGADIISTGTTTGYAWEVTTSGVAYVPAGAYVRFTCNFTTAVTGTNSKVRIAKLMSL